MQLRTWRCVGIKSKADSLIFVVELHSILSEELGAENREISSLILWLDVDQALLWAFRAGGVRLSHCITFWRDHEGRRVDMVRQRRKSAVVVCAVASIRITDFS